MNSFTLFLALAFCATLVCRTDTEQCETTDYWRCGYLCHGSENICTCGKQSWTGYKGKQSWKGYKVSDDEGCCPSSSDSCIKDNDGETLYEKETKFLIFSFLLFFTGNVNCSNGSVIQLGEKCPKIQQCLTQHSFVPTLICEDETCSKNKNAYEICRGIPNVACKK